MAALAVVGTLLNSACANDVHDDTESSFSAGEVTTGGDESSTTGSESTSTTTTETTESTTESTSSGGAESDTGTTTTEDPNCEEKRIIFITNNRFTGALGGLYDADQLCEKVFVNRQDSEGINPDTLFAQAWLADGIDSPKNRLPEFCGEYQDPNGTVIAKSHEDLLNSELINPLVVDENGEEVSGTV